MMRILHQQSQYSGLLSVNFLPMINVFNGDKACILSTECLLSNAIVHIVTRKAVQRALRDHLLVEKCMHSQFSVEMTKEDPDIQMLLDHAKDLYSSLLRGKTTLADDM
ncbi:hypothetical protein DPMN_089701 [Dreissena polymorpha]|uniref:Uncharacterized protein n=1 Tax=Dreissena polymorpha TaxID=45954 RepID=A0A9D4QZ52_DREPO|nr:hypothetical protein DPMN_089701 [Dreissena polymorpha]